MAPARGNQRRRAASGRSPGKGEGPGDEEAGGWVPGLPDLIRRAFSLGLSGFFLTEEALRKALGDKVPRDWVDFAVEQSDRTRAEFLERLAAEIARVFQESDLAALVEQLLEGRTVEVSARIRLGPKETGAKGRRTKISATRITDES